MYVCLDGLLDGWVVDAWMGEWIGEDSEFVNARNYICMFITNSIMSTAIMSTLTSRCPWGD